MSNIIQDENNNPVHGGPPAGQNAPAPGPSDQPVIQLTPQQLTDLIAQAISANAAAQQAASGAKPAEAPAPETKPEPQGETGKRILYQSPDFEEEEAPAPRLGPSTGASYDSLGDDDVTEPPQRPVRSFDFDERYGSARPVEDTSGVKLTSFGDNFRVAEMELDDSELPSLPVRRARRPEVDAPFASTPKGMTVEEFEVEEPPKKKPKPSRGEIVRRVVLAISIVVLIGGLLVLAREYKLHKDNQKLEQDVQNMIITGLPTTEAPTEPPTTKKSGKKKQKETTEPTEPPTTEPTIQMQWEQIKREYPNVIFPPNTQLKYARLYATNQDFVGYLSAENTNLNLPVVQAVNDEIYLTKNFYGQNTKYGCPFVTHLNNISELDMNTVIFGHHMNDGTVFGALDKYKTIDGYRAAPVIEFNTLYRDYKWKIIAAFITNAYEKDDNGYVFCYYFTKLSSQERFAAYLNELSQRSIYLTNEDVQSTDKILTLSTCSHEFEDARFVVVARLLREGESDYVDVGRAVANPNPRYPAAYYEKKKLTNPYENAYRWQVE